MKWIKKPENITLTFVNGYLHKVEQYRVSRNKKLKVLKVRDVQFLDDMRVFFKTTRLPIFELMQWLHFKNKNIEIEIVDSSTMKLINLTM